MSMVIAIFITVGSQPAVIICYHASLEFNPPIIMAWSPSGHSLIKCWWSYNLYWLTIWSDSDDLLITPSIQIYTPAMLMVASPLVNDVILWIWSPPVSGPIWRWWAIDQQCIPQEVGARRPPFLDFFLLVGGVIVGRRGYLKEGDEQLINNAYLKLEEED